MLFSRLPEGPPLFKPVKGYDTGAIADFLEKISVLGNWLFVKHLQNHRSKLFTNEIALSFWRTTQAGMDEDHDPAELMPLDTALQADLPYLFDDEYRKWSPPAFRLKVENMGNRRLCISALLLGYNFGVTNCLLPRQFLNPGEFVWLLQKHKHHTYQTIRLRRMTTIQAGGPGV
ncbi:MAG: hypothetical protein R2824_09840 [Saprospiraceae bacterium]